MRSQPKKPDRPTDDREAIHSAAPRTAGASGATIGRRHIAGTALLRQLALHDADARTRATAISALADVADGETDFQAIALERSVDRGAGLGGAFACRRRCWTPRILRNSSAAINRAAVRAEALRRDTIAVDARRGVGGVGRPDPFLQQAARQALGQMPSATVAHRSGQIADCAATARRDACSASGRRAGRAKVSAAIVGRSRSGDSIRRNRMGRRRARQGIAAAGLSRSSTAKADTRELFEACVAALELTRRHATARRISWRAICGSRADRCACIDADATIGAANAAAGSSGADDRAGQRLSSLRRMKRCASEAIRSLRESPRAAGRIGFAGRSGRRCGQFADSLRAEAIVGLVRSPSRNAICCCRWPPAMTRRFGKKRSVRCAAPR